MGAVDYWKRLAQRSTTNPAYPEYVVEGLGVAAVDDKVCPLTKQVA
jgi:hypothetical protein